MKNTFNIQYCVKDLAGGMGTVGRKFFLKHQTQSQSKSQSIKPWFSGINLGLHEEMGVTETSKIH